MGLLLPGPLLIVIEVHQGPESSDRRRPHCRDDTGIHKEARVTARKPGPEDSEAAAHGHGDRHREGRSQREHEIGIRDLFSGRRLLDLHRFPVDRLQTAGRSVVKRPPVGFGLHGPGFCTPGLCGPGFHGGSLFFLFRNKQFQIGSIHLQVFFLADRQDLSQIDHVQTPNMDVVSESEEPAAVDPAVVDIEPVLALVVDQEGAVIGKADLRHIAADILISLIAVGIADHVARRPADGDLRHIFRHVFPVADKGGLLESHDDSQPLPPQIQRIVCAVQQADMGIPARMLPAGSRADISSCPVDSILFVREEKPFSPVFLQMERNILVQLKDLAVNFDAVFFIVQCGEHELPACAPAVDHQNNTHKVPSLLFPGSLPDRSVSPFILHLFFIAQN